MLLEKLLLSKGKQTWRKTTSFVLLLEFDLVLLVSHFLGTLDPVDEVIAHFKKILVLNQEDVNLCIHGKGYFPVNHVNELMNLLNGVL